MKTNGSVQRQMTETDGNGKKNQLTRGYAFCGDEFSPSLRNAPRSPSSDCMSRTKVRGNDNSLTGYTDKTGVNLTDFIISTLHKNPKDREMMLSLEKDMRAFIEDPKQRALRFPRMSSYNRMLIHRAAAFFGLDHNIDNSASCVICTKAPRTRIPDIEFKQLIRDDVYTDHLIRAQGPRRTTQSFDEGYISGYSSTPRRLMKYNQSNSVDLSYPMSYEFESPLPRQATPVAAASTNPPLTSISYYNVRYQPTPYCGPPICLPHTRYNSATKDSSPQQDSGIESHRLDDSDEPNLRNTDSTTNTVFSEDTDQPQHLYPIYDPNYFTSLHGQAVIYHTVPGVPVGYAVFKDDNVKLVAQADISALSGQMNTMNIAPEQYPSVAGPIGGTGYAMTSPAYVPGAMPQGMTYSGPSASATPNMTYLASPVAPMGPAYANYSNQMFYPMYTMVPNVVPSQQSYAAPATALQFDPSLPGPSGSNSAQFEST